MFLDFGDRALRYKECRVSGMMLDEPRTRTPSTARARSWHRGSAAWATRPAALPAALEVSDELVLTQLLLCHQGIESPTCLTQRLALLELRSAVHRDVEADRPAVSSDRDWLGGLQVASGCSRNWRIPTLAVSMTSRPV